MDCILIFFNKKLEPVQVDPANRGHIKVSWSEALKVNYKDLNYFKKIIIFFFVFKFLTNSQFLNMVVNFNKDIVNAETIDLLEPYFDKPDYNIVVAKKVCQNMGIVRVLYIFLFFV
jgi:dynein heavy chain